MMKNSIATFLILTAMTLSGCCTNKTNEGKTTAGKTDLYDYAWELEYISGPRIAFSGLYPEQKPFIMFNEKTRQYSGNTSCNGYSGQYTKKENNIQFGEAMKTMIFCEGGGEETFLKMLGKSNTIGFDNDNKLVLSIDDVVVMRFKKIAKPQ